MIYNILIVGLGQLGARYLQGLINVGPLYDIDILEPSDMAYQKGIGVLQSGGASLVNVSRVTFQNLKARYRVVIVATSSAPRAEVVSAVSINTCVDNWVIEKVLAQTEGQLQTILNSVCTKGAWVNTPRRRTSVYRALKPLLSNGRPIRFEGNLPNLGLGCNSIHFIDVVSWLVDSAVAHVEVASPQGWKLSKRDGYKEFEGELTAHYEDGSLLRLKSDFEGAVSIAVYQDEKVFSVSETEGVYEGEYLHSGRVEYQSELSYELIRDIIEKKIGDGLPTIQQSVEQHIALFKAIRNCEALQIEPDSGLPIT